MNAFTGAVMGWIIVIAYGLSLLNYVIKFINRKWGKNIRKNENMKKIFQVLTTFLVKNHRIFGYITLAGILGHFIIQYRRWGFVTSGAVAAGLMIAQAGLGAYGAYQKKSRKGAWLVLHRIIAVLLLAAIVYHIWYAATYYSF